MRRAILRGRRNSQIELMFWLVRNRVPALNSSRLPAPRNCERLHTMPHPDSSQQARKSQNRTGTVREHDYLPRSTYKSTEKSYHHHDRPHSGYQPDADLSRTSPRRIAMRKAAAEVVRAKIRSTAASPKSQTHDRHVRFQTDLPTRDSPVHPAYRQRERPRSGTAGLVAPIDHEIALHGGSTSTLECLPHRLRISKAQPATDPKSRIEELQRENGHLRREITYYKDTLAVHVKFFDSIQVCAQELRDALTEASRGIAISEQRYVEYWAPYRTEGNILENVF